MYVRFRRSFFPTHTNQQTHTHTPHTKPINYLRSHRLLQRQQVGARSLVPRLLKGLPQGLERPGEEQVEAEGAAVDLSEVMVGGRMEVLFGLFVCVGWFDY